MLIMASSSMAATFAPHGRTTAKITRSLVLLRRAALSHCKKYGRHNLPWRKERDPWKVLVSEVMLQQTQVDRVVPYYQKFIQLFPTPRSLARSSLARVLKVWSGLGYNRRAKYLHEVAKQWGRVPLEDLPGVGPYTANAVRVFAYNEPRSLLETNIRTVYLHHLFPHSRNVPDSKLLPYIVVPKGVEPRLWYAALMDYGAHLKSAYSNPSRRSTRYKQPAAFKGSDRQIRGAILRAHLSGTRVSGFDQRRVRALTNKLKAEGLI